MFQVTTYPDAAAFLACAQPALEASEAANSLLLGICLRLVRQPELVAAPSCLKTVDDDRGLILAAAMLPPWKIVVSDLRGDPDEAARALTAGLLAEGWAVPGVQGPAGAAASVAACLAAATGRRLRLERHEHLYALRAMPRFVPAAGRLRPADEADAPLIGRWWYGSNLAAFGQADVGESERVAHRCLAAGDVYVWDVGRPVSQAVKTSPTRRGISVGRVYTPPEERGHGYATACVGELSRLLLAGGRAFTTLYVEAGNEPAQRVYRRVGYEWVCDYHEIALDE